MALYVESLGAHGRLLATTTGVIFAVTGVASAVGRRGGGAGAIGPATARCLGAPFSEPPSFALPQGLVARAWQLFRPDRIRHLIGGIVPAVQAMIVIRAPGDRRAGIMGVTSTALMLGNLCGPLVGGAVAGSFDWSVFVLATGVFVVLLVGVYPRGRAGADRRRAPRGEGRGRGIRAAAPRPRRPGAAPDRSSTESTLPAGSWNQAITGPRPRWIPSRPVRISPVYCSNRTPRSVSSSTTRSTLATGKLRTVYVAGVWFGLAYIRTTAPLGSRRWSIPVSSVTSMPRVSP